MHHVLCRTLSYLSAKRTPLALAGHRTPLTAESSGASLYDPPAPPPPPPPHLHPQRVLTVRLILAELHLSVALTAPPAVSTHQRSPTSTVRPRQPQQHCPAERIQMMAMTPRGSGLPHPSPGGQHRARLSAGFPTTTMSPPSRSGQVEQKSGVHNHRSRFLCMLVQRWRRRRRYSCQEW